MSKIVRLKEDIKYVRCTNFSLVVYKHKISK